MHITNTSSPSRTAPPTTAPVRIPVLVLGVGVGLSVLPETILLPVLLVATELVVVTELVAATELVVKGLTVTSGQKVSSTIPLCSDKRL